MNYCRTILLFVNLSIPQMNVMKAANKELKGMMKTVKIEDIDVCFSFSLVATYYSYLTKIFLPHVHFFIRCYHLSCPHPVFCIMPIP